MWLRLHHTLKTPGSDLTRKRVPWGQTHSWADWSGIQVKITRNLSPKCLSDSDSRSVWPGFRVSLTWIPGRSDPKMGLAHSHTFRVKSNPGVFRVHVIMLFKSFWRILTESATCLIALYKTVSLSLSAYCPGETEHRKEGQIKRY